MSRNVDDDCAFYWRKVAVKFSVEVLYIYIYIYNSFVNWEKLPSIALICKHYYLLIDDKAIDDCAVYWRKAHVKFSVEVLYTSALAIGRKLPSIALIRKHY